MRAAFLFRIALGLLLALVTAVTAHAWEWTPEFQSLTETEQSALEGPGRFASEYAADILSYLKPADWEYEWLTHSQAMDLGLGSLSATHFMVDNRLKIHARLSEHFEFRFLHTIEQNRERDTHHEIFETIYFPAEKLGFSFYGEPTLYKRETDTGLALIYKPQARHEIRLFNTFVDVARLKRSDTPDNFIEPFLPYSRGLVGRLWSDPEGGLRNFLEYAVRYETHTRWVFPEPAPGYEYAYWKAFGGVFGSKTFSKNQSVNLRVQFDRKSEMRQSAWRTDRLLALGQTVFRRIGPSQSWDVTAGISFSDRWWRMTEGSVEYRDFLPHLLWSRKGWTVGYLSTWHRAWGPAGLRDPQDDDGRWENRLNLSYEFKFGTKAKLVLLVSGDLDRAFTDKSWDGGGGRFHMNF
ncbi:MAG TPA: hypothetical protein DCS07_15120 [Bdellovibrionales bacterium]|nr:MAG: hypothetical protein A2Z97_16370 [Bdellovibrionales bacterium GWB1_52_6]OFZ03841.1 MAG: hypothetical protein A2X97_15695 [Bdellovibrionales bacterium GWA1_52_35]OFZ38672.1 MAG: hypothetical protein A2070_10795 [Bdellovibrionales bacterium GWC1_52_8]HAR43942.1 hypothetical protein [Bdellovibrionales bacterium]HCM39724.1 hypothetical protein [Bdellovibrionales bacterium]